MSEDEKLSAITKILDDLDRRNKPYESPLSKIMGDMTKTRHLYESPVSKIMGDLAKNQRLYESPLSKIMGDMTKTRHLYESPVSKIMGDLAKNQRPYESPLSKIMGDMTKTRHLYESPVSKFMGDLAKNQRLYESPLSKIMGDIAKTRDLYESPVSKIIGDIAKTRRAYAEISALRFPFDLEPLTAGLESAHQAPDLNEDAGEKRENAEEAFVSAIDHLLELGRGARSKIERRAVIGLILWLLPLLLEIYHIYSTDNLIENSRAEIQQEVRGAEKNLLADARRRSVSQMAESAKVQQKLDEIKQLFEQDANDPSGEFYIAKRVVPLCEAKNFCGKRFGFLWPGSEIQLLQRSGKWIYVEAALDDGSVQKGWVLKKYLRREVGER